MCMGCLAKKNGSATKSPAPKNYVHRNVGGRPSGSPAFGKPSVKMKFNSRAKK